MLQDWSPDAPRALCTGASRHPPGPAATGTALSTEHVGVWSVGGVLSLREVFNFM